MNGSLLNKFLVLILLVLFFLIFFPTLDILANDEEEWEPGNLQDITGELEQTGGEQGMGLDTKRLAKEDTVYKIIGRWIYWVTAFLGVIFTILIIYGGWLWLTAAGNEEQITKAKSIIKNSVIALFIILAAWAISVVILSYVSGQPTVRI